jgi:hypothetical protein
MHYIAEFLRETLYQTLQVYVPKKPIWTSASGARYAPQCMNFVQSYTHYPMSPVLSVFTDLRLLSLVVCAVSLFFFVYDRGGEDTGLWKYQSINKPGTMRSRSQLCMTTRKISPVETPCALP